jgi:GNAT superfamily N-acetyltransferase
MQRNMIRLVTLSGPAMIPRLPDLTRLRASVFRDWPYLYDAPASGVDRDMAGIPSIEGAALVLALDGERAVGCATVFRLATESPNLRLPFARAGHDLERYCYFGESVLEPAYRGQGLGVGFFAAREAHARSLPGIDRAVFCSVVRPDDHPLRPTGAGDLHAFWRKRGYQETDLVCTMHWKQVDTADKVENTLRFWEKKL